MTNENAGRESVALTEEIAAVMVAHAECGPVNTDGDPIRWTCGVTVRRPEGDRWGWAHIDRLHVAASIAARLAAQPVPAPSRTEATWHHGCTCGVAPEWSLIVEHDTGCPFGKQLAGVLAAREAGALREAADEWELYGPVTAAQSLRGRADRILRATQTTEDGAS